MSAPVAAALDALLGLVSEVDTNGVRVGLASAGFGEVQVFDGPPLADQEIGDALALGLAIEDISAAYGDERPRFGERREESHSITGLVQSSSGGVDISASRARAYELHDALRDVLVANRSLDGAWDFARLIRSTYRPVQTPDGCLVLIEFAIRVDATRFEGA